MGRVRICTVLLALGFVVLAAMPARAGSVWGANDAGHRLDTKWGTFT
jgi:hypothetical protein